MKRHWHCIEMLTWKKLKPTFGWGKTERKKYSNLPAVALGHWEIFKINVLACAKEAVCNLGTMQTRWKKSYLHTEMSKSCVCDSSKGGGGGRFFFFFFASRKSVKINSVPRQLTEDCGGFVIWSDPSSAPFICGRDRTFLFHCPFYEHAIS